MDKRDRIVRARLKLRERFLARMEATPARADADPQGSGPNNRHGMPKLPPGQTAVTKWPVLDLGIHPRVAADRWRLVVDGAVASPVELDWTAFCGLEQVELDCDFHCVTTWSLLDVRFSGVRLSTVIALAEPSDDATHVTTHAYDGYTTNLPLEETLKDDVLLVSGWQGRPLPVEHGGPVRVVTPQLWAWKGAKWVSRIELHAGDRPGFWEVRGYSNTAHPWRDDRYSG